MSEAHYSKASGAARRVQRLEWAFDEESPPGRPTPIDRKIQPGDFVFVNRLVALPDGTNFEHVGGMNYVCLGCKTVGHLPFRKPSLWPKQKHDWHWDGNRDKPTLTPSIHHVGCWHGHLVNGVFKSC